MSGIAKATPIFVVESVDPCTAFWEGLGFTCVATVPHGEETGFVILVKDAIELMYQSAASAAADDPALAARINTGGSALFVEVEDLAQAVAATAGAPIVMQQRETFYGMREVGVMDPGGNFIMLAQKIA